MEGGPDAGLLATLVERVTARRVVPGRTWVQGIGGPQGSGKSTLAAALARELRGRGLAVATLSLDDIYFTHAERGRLAREVHPLFAVRGPPGTHDVALGLATLDAVSRPGGTALPRFDKAADDRAPPEPFDGPADVVVLDGWCLGATPEPDPAVLDRPLNAVEREADPRRAWRRAVEAALAHGYPELWARLDGLLQLQPPDWETVVAWRMEQEHALRDRLLRDGGPGHAMTDAEVARFVQHYERITRRLMRSAPPAADLVVRLNSRRRPTA